LLVQEKELMTMKDGNSRSNPESKSDAGNTPFKQMTPKQKWVFVLQVVVCLVTFGFIFPNVIG